MEREKQLDNQNLRRRRFGERKTKEKLKLNPTRRTISKTTMMMMVVMMLVFLSTLFDLGNGQFSYLFPHHHHYHHNVMTRSRQHSSKKVSSLFIIGDSSVTCGTNHTFFYSLLRPNSSLFPCNGSQTRLLPDLLAEKMGLPEIPAFHAENGTIQGLKSGLNFGSTQATIMVSGRSGSAGLNKQLRQAFETIQLLQLQLGWEKAQMLIESSVFYLSLGKDDYIDFIYYDSFGVRRKFGSLMFAQDLVSQMIQVVKDLYNANVKKIICMGIGPLGCAPRTLWESYDPTSDSSYETTGSRRDCVDDVNDLILEYNAMLSEQLLDLNFELPDAQIIFCDVYQAMMEIITFPNRYGFENVNRSCCGSGPHGGMAGCQAMEIACNDSSTHFWWDFYNPTQAVHSLLANSAWTGQPMDICRPISIEQLRYTSTL